METILEPNQSLFVYNVQADSFGDVKQTGTPAELLAFVEDTQGFEHGEFADMNTGNITAYILPSSEFYTSKGGRLFGLLATFNRYAAPDSHDWYRIASVRPGESLITYENDFVELTLTRVAKKG